MNPILVTGAAGRQGSTGRHTVLKLLARGFPVRAMVRQEDDRSKELARQGAEIVVADYFDFGSLKKALHGVSDAYFCYPIAAGVTEAAGLFAEAGKSEELRRVVTLSLGSASPTAASPQAKALFVAERIFEWAGFEGVNLRILGFFMENILMMDAPSIQARDLIANSFGAAELAWIAGEDVGSVAASLLADPSRWGERTLSLVGPIRLNYPQLARALTDVLGRQIDYRELTPNEWHEALTKALSARGQENARGADHLVAQSVALKARVLPAPDDLFQAITGDSPTSFSQFVIQHRDRFTPH